MNETTDITVYDAEIRELPVLSRIVPADYSIIVREKEVEIPKDMLYIVGKTGDYYGGGILASQYDIFANELGMSFSPMENVQISENGHVVQASMKAHKINRYGQTQIDSITYRIDVRDIYEEARYKQYQDIMKNRGVEIWENERNHWEAYGYKVVNGRGKKLFVEIKLEPFKKHIENGVITYSYELPDPLEMQMSDNLRSLKRNALAKLETVMHRRLTSRAIGIKTIKIPVSDVDAPKWGAKTIKRNQKIKLKYIDIVPAKPAKEEKKPDPLLRSMQGELRKSGDEFNKIKAKEMEEEFDKNTNAKKKALLDHIINTAKEKGISMKELSKIREDKLKKPTELCTIGP